MNSARKYSSQQFFDIQFAGQSMQEMSCDVIKTEKTSVVSRWFRSHQDVNLYVWEDSKNNVIKQCLVTSGQVVEWNIIEGVKTGISYEEGPDEETFASISITTTQSADIKYDAKPVGTAVKQAEQILLQMGVLANEYRQALVLNFRRSPRADNMDPKEFLKVYGHNLPTDEDDGPLVKLVHWLRRLNPLK